MNALFSALYAHVLWPLRQRIDTAQEDGLEAVEYALIAALIAAVLVAGVTALRDEIGNVLEYITNSLRDSGSPPAVG